MANLHYIDYAPIKTSLVKEGDVMLVRNVENRIGENAIYRLVDGKFVNIPHDFHGRSGILDFAKELANNG